MKSLSLLYARSQDLTRNKVGNSFCNFVLYDAIRNILANHPIYAVMVKNIDAGPISQENIEWRHEIFRDFINNEGSIDVLLGEFSLLNQCFFDYNEQKKNNYHSISSAHSNDLFVATNSALQITAFFFKKIEAIFEQILNINNKGVFCSRGLQRMFSRLSELVDTYNVFFSNDWINKLIGFYPNEVNYSYQINFNDWGRISSISIFDVKKATFDNKNKNSFFKKKSRVETPVNNTGFDELIQKEVINLINALISLIESFKQEFSSIFSDLQFYKGGIDLISFYNEKNISYCFPTINSYSKFDKLYDLTLLSENKTVTPYNYVLNDTCRGTLVFGVNGSGKSVFCRTVYSAYVLSLVGLPIPSKEATVKHYSSLFYLTVSQENTKNNMGRFEEEVKHISELIDCINSTSLVFINELFQSTREREGSRAMIDILDFMDKHSVTWFLVTHLTSVINHYQSELGVNEYNFKEKYIK